MIFNNCDLKCVVTMANVLKMEGYTKESELKYTKIEY